ncbi:hypothetical protein RB614_10430 [Phytohabitans sp. ZYX-F-186]|uniref:PH domain-containing protein n=1 Tax=Phytohabitans maris TaxID=3071409 RepID=A0ABU0ZF09_9ACTN|nr:hypothetical protein [Phytohabitans sp. ZYX-F-186]MDQ7904937.1 hypothetical protein [Phytohabitans sp. ZYX-F-186]
MSEAEPQVVRPNQVLGWSAVVVAVAATGAAGAFADRLWARLLWVGVMLLLLEELWRYDLRPRLLWNDGGLVLVDGRGVHRHPWAEVTAIGVRDNRVSVRTPEGMLEARFDRPWWLARVHPSTRDLPTAIEARLRAAHDAGLGGTGAEPPPAPRVRRPAALFLLAAAGVLAVMLPGL